MRSLGLEIITVFVGTSALFRRDRIVSAFDTDYLRLICCLVVLVLDRDAGALCLSFPTTAPLMAGNRPASVAVADLDGVTANPSLVDASLIDALDAGRGCACDQAMAMGAER
jgi:hypothetical protein